MLRMKGNAIKEKAELWESIMATLNIHTECIHSSDWKNHKIGLCVCKSFTCF